MCNNDLRVTSLGLFFVISILQEKWHLNLIGIPRRSDFSTAD